MSKTANYIQMAGGLLLLIGAMMQITRWEFAPYIYMVGAILFAAIQVRYGYDGRNIVIRRLRRQQMLGAAFLVVAGVLMFFTHHNEWVLCLSIAAVLQLYTAFRIPSELEKEQKK